jgi:hypothetical protein
MKNDIEDKISAVKIEIEDKIVARISGMETRKADATGEIYNEKTLHRSNPHRVHLGP